MRHNVALATCLHTVACASSFPTWAGKLPDKWNPIHVFKLAGSAAFPRTRTLQGNDAQSEHYMRIRSGARMINDCNHWVCHIKCSPIICFLNFSPLYWFYISLYKYETFITFFAWAENGFIVSRISFTFWKRYNVLEWSLHTPLSRIQTPSCRSRAHFCAALQTQFNSERIPLVSHSLVSSTS